MLSTRILCLYGNTATRRLAGAAAHGPEELTVTVITVQEQLDGWHSRLPRTHKPKELADLYRRIADTVAFLARVKILHYTETAIERYTELRKLCPKIGRMDLRIAATALEHDAIVVTRNTRDFRRIPGLQIEDWSQ